MGNDSPAVLEREVLAIKPEEVLPTLKEVYEHFYQKGLLSIDSSFRLLVFEIADSFFKAVWFAHILPIPSVDEEIAVTFEAFSYLESSKMKGEQILVLYLAYTNFLKVLQTKGQLQNLGDLLHDFAKVSSYFRLNKIENECLAVIYSFFAEGGDSSTFLNALAVLGVQGKSKTLRFVEFQGMKIRDKKVLDVLLHIFWMHPDIADTHEMLTAYSNSVQGLTGDRVDLLIQ
jgi:hypothetical protein